MNFSKLKLMAVFSLILVFGAAAFAQTADNGTPSQRLDIMSQKLNTLRDSLRSSISVLKKDKNAGAGEKDPGTPLGRMVSLEKDAGKYIGEVNTLRGKITRAEKFEVSDIDQLEEEVARFSKSVDTAQLETAELRAQPVSSVGKPRETEKKKKFLGIFGGGSDEFDELLGSVTPGRDRELFIVATREIRKKSYETGRLLFQTIISTYPDSPYLPMAKLAVADSFFLEGATSGLIQASANYQDWLTFFPTHPLADRVLLKIAESEMRQIGLPDRDPTRAKKAEQRLLALLQKYPNSELRPLVEKRLQEVQDNLALHNLYVGNYYYKQAVTYGKQGLKGAQGRFLDNIKKYPNFSFMDENLYKLAVTYVVEEETDQAVRYFQEIVRNYPRSERTEDAKKQLQLLGAEVPTPDPSKVKEIPAEKQSFLTSFKNEFFGSYPMTIDKNGVLMTKDYDKSKFELIDQVVENQGDLRSSQIPKALTTVLSEKPKGSK